MLSLKRNTNESRTKSHFIVSGLIFLFQSHVYVCFDTYNFRVATNFLMWALTLMLYSPLATTMLLARLCLDTMKHQPDALSCMLHLPKYLIVLAMLACWVCFSCLLFTRFMISNGVWDYMLHMCVCKRRRKNTLLCYNINVLFTLLLPV